MLKHVCHFTFMLTFAARTSAILYDLNSRNILYEQNAEQLIQPASLTKIMTLYLAFESINAGKLSYSLNVPISKAAAEEGGSRMGIMQGETVRLGDLLRGIAISSGNDASLAVAEFLSGSKENFIQLMNKKAEALGMRKTHFCTPNGLPDPRQYTTAKDMLLLARTYLTRYPHVLNLHRERVLKHNAYVSWNKNPLLNQYPGCDGLKTGWVKASGYNIIFTALRGNHRLIGVILGAHDPAQRGLEACRLLDAGFLVCAKRAKTVLQALENLPQANYKLNFYQNAQEAIQLFGYVSQGHPKRGKRCVLGTQKKSKPKKRKDRTRRS
ncbi:MAG: D-alanyl-D-alanine carboxypeptidase [Desulfovibrio sp.]|nr:D-alanyl-D-alanine carboxypeptidase [Desulfovibrio sp.]